MGCASQQRTESRSWRCCLVHAGQQGWGGAAQAPHVLVLICVCHHFSMPKAHSPPVLAAVSREDGCQNASCLNYSGLWLSPSSLIDPTQSALIGSFHLTQAQWWDLMGPLPVLPLWKCVWPGGLSPHCCPTPPLFLVFSHVPGSPPSPPLYLPKGATPLWSVLCRVGAAPCFCSPVPTFPPRSALVPPTEQRGESMRSSCTPLPVPGAVGSADEVIPT